MNTEWSLKEIYTGFDDPKYEEDFAKLTAVLKDRAELIAQADTKSEKELVETLLQLEESINLISYRLGLYQGLRQSVDTENGEIMAQSGRLDKLMSAAAGEEVAAKKILAGVEQLDTLAAESDIIASYQYLIARYKEESSHLLNSEVEEMVAAMNITGGGAWGQLQSFLTSTLKVDFRGEVITLSEVRNLAYDADAATRKEAYEAELQAYEKIEDSIAFSLNNIKSQVRMLCEKKGYESPLAMTLEYSDLKRETLDAMIGAIEEYLPVFHKYLRHKGEKLGHKNGLPWYDLFAPMGDIEQKYTIEEAREYLLKCFGEFDEEIAGMMQEAFDNDWIDFYPKKGKEGGAFCADANFIGQSRILTNYDGTFGAVGTLAHELGHAYHNRQLEKVKPLLQDAPMQLAETASTFNETHLGAYANRTANDATKLLLLENDLREQTQCIVDIYSRYLFETAVFEKCEDDFMMAADLKQLMLEAQQKAYGDGLDPDVKHPYMWVCKGHYYSSGLSFYNFPYAFGNLFALGLYSQFKKEGKSFIPKYNKMLSSTGAMCTEDVAAQMGIDVTKRDFWRSSLQLIADQVEVFCTL